jgi:cytochrome oxidase assembly protein ShyY1
MLKLALTARWIAALFFCLMLAVIFALMAQWQISRTFIENASNDAWTQVKVVELESITKPNDPYVFNEISQVGKETVLTKTRTELSFSTSKVLLISDRIQLNGDRGYWLVVPARTMDAELFVAAGFVQGEAKAKEVLANVKELVSIQALMPVVGRYLPSEAPVESLSADMYSTLSVPQLINNELDEGMDSNTYTGFLAITESSIFSDLEGVQPLTIGLAKRESEVNWLSAFYAIEWTIFAGFAVFMWWRLLADAYKKQQAALLAE